ncbi:MAG: hypothetical protein RQ899_14080 [Pseudomonadales bacterium]|nr:hypothetical protein [Pseudomonadales bacterium]
MMEDGVCVVQGIGRITMRAYVTHPVLCQQACQLIGWAILLMDKHFS